jgi:hypothetical protein
MEGTFSRHRAGYRGLAFNVSQQWRGTLKVFLSPPCIFKAITIPNIGKSPVFLTKDPSHETEHVDAAIDPFIFCFTGWAGVQKNMDNPWLTIELDLDS